MSLFELELLGGPWEKRLRARRRGFDDFPWDERVGPDEAARDAWTRNALSEYASAAAFAEIASSLLACGAPIDLVAAAGDFVVDEMLHTELAARLAMTFGGAIPLEVDRARLVRPPSSEGLLATAERIVRTCCIGEALTVPVMKAARSASGSPLVSAVMTRIVRDESAHAELGGWFLDWASPRLDDADRKHLGRVARDTLASFAQLHDFPCRTSGLGLLDCTTFGQVFAKAARTRVIEPLAARGIDVSCHDGEKAFARACPTASRRIIRSRSPSDFA